MRRMPVIDDKLSNLIVERDSVRIQLSLLGDEPYAPTEELASLRTRRGSWKSSSAPASGRFDAPQD